MTPDLLSIEEARRLLFRSQKLLGPRVDSLALIEHLGYVQIDTLAVIERAHHHVLWSRNSDYRPSDLDALVKDRKVFEYWTHAASYLPMRDYRFSLPLKKKFKENPWFPKDENLRSVVVKRLQTEGSLMSKDFQDTKKGTHGWWDWKPMKKVLEQLFLEGRLEISQREGFQKVYDLSENVIPSTIDTTMPSDSEYMQFLIDRTLRHHGLASIDEMAYLQKKETKLRLSLEINRLLAEKKIIQVRVENSSGVYFALPDSLNNLSELDLDVCILSPFDNMVIQRKKLKTFFDFDYQIECYLPVSKRKYGYFSLPVFLGTWAVARLDCKADRKANTFFINAIHYESGVDVNAYQLQEKLTAKLIDFARFNGCHTLVSLVSDS